MNLQEALARFERESKRGVFDTERYRMRYWDWGDGPPLVIIHGMNDLPRSFCQIMSRLSKRYRCIIYDLPIGLGDGAKLSAYRTSHYSADLLELIDHLNLHSPAILGCSFGSTVALQALHDAPDRIRVGMIQGGFARRPLIKPERVLASFARLFPGRMKHMPGRVAMMKKIDFRSFQNSPTELWRMLVENSGVTPIKAVAYRGLLLDRTDLRSLLPKIRTPLLMIGGDADELVPKEYEIEVLHGTPTAKRIEFASCGHYPQYVRPDEMVAAMEQFLAVNN